MKKTLLLQGNFFLSGKVLELLKGLTSNWRFFVCLCFVFFSSLFSRLCVSPSSVPPGGGCIAVFKGVVCLHAAPICVFSPSERYKALQFFHPPRQNILIFEVLGYFGIISKIKEEFYEPHFHSSKSLQSLSPCWDPGTPSGGRGI